MNTNLHPPTPCCQYCAPLAMPYPVMWNPGNEVVQCHNCGWEYRPIEAPNEDYGDPDEISAHIVSEDARYPILCINGKFTYGMSMNPETGDVNPKRLCICHARSREDCICTL